MLKLMEAPRLTGDHADEVGIFRFALAFSQLEQLLEREEVDVVGSVDRLGHAVYLVSDGYAAAQLRVVLDVVHPGVSCRSKPAKLKVQPHPRRVACMEETGWSSHLPEEGVLVHTTPSSPTRDSQQTRIVQHGHDVPDHIEVRLGHVQPAIERRDQLRSHLLAGHRVEVGKRLEQDLMSAVIVSRRCAMVQGRNPDYGSRITARRCDACNQPRWAACRHMQEADSCQREDDARRRPPARLGGASAARLV